MSAMESYNFWFLMMKKQNNWDNISSSKLCPWWTLMELFMETIGLIFQGTISTENGQILPKFIILKSFSSRNWSWVFNKLDKLFFFVIFTGILWRKMPLFMVVTILKILGVERNFHFCLVNFSKLFLSKTAVFLIWRKNKEQVEQF